MTFNTMSSFAPALPSLPTYPRQLAPSREASPPFRHSSKKPRHQSYPSTATASHTTHSLHRSQRLTPDTTDSDDGLMTHSVYSDRDYRTSLVGSRKRGLADDSDSDYGHGRGRAEGGGGKRRIIDVVGGTLGGVLRGAWQIFRPRLPWTAPSPPAVLEIIDEKMDHPEHPVLRRGASWGGSEDRRPWGVDDRRATWENPMPGQWDATSPPSRTSTHRWREGSPPPTAHSAASYFDSASMAPTLTDSGMNARWVMVSPAPSLASTATSSKRTAHTRSHSSPSTTGRRQRPVTKKRALKPPRSPQVQSQSVFTFGMSSSRPTSSKGKKGRLGPEEDEMDEDMRRFNEQLKAMIHEGKEALGATVEVVYDDDDMIY